MVLGFLFGFLFGALVIVVVEALGLLFLINRLNRRTDVGASSARVGTGLDSQQSLEFAYNKQGIVWVLEPDKIPKEQKRKKEVQEVSPVRKYARIKDQSLILTESDGFHIVIPLKGCIILAVSATSRSLRKWAKKYPIKVENKTSVIHNGSRTFYIYLETSWEKESWCKALRLASFDSNEKIECFVKLSEEFHGYLRSLNSAYPSFLKPFMFHAESMEKTNKIDGSSSKVRHFWKKLAKKASKAGSEKSTGHSLSGREERKASDKNPAEDSIALPSSSMFPSAGSTSHLSVVSDTEADDKCCIDEGTLCWNLLISRLFFDAKSSMEIINSCKAQIQKTLSTMRIPTYIGDIMCTGIHTGNIPPYIHSMRVLPMDMNEVWAFEIDIEYSGGAALDIETRLKGTAASSESNSDGEILPDLLEEFEKFGEQLKLSEGSGDVLEQKDEVDPKQDDTSKSTSLAPIHVPRWKSLLNSVAKQVSQTPLSLTIKVASLRGTMRLHIKPPPSDQLWFCFTSMPDIDLQLESSVGDCKINSGHIAVMLVNRFKAAIRDTLVLPNCEYVCIPWMLGEKDDWAPLSVAPFIWLNQEGCKDPATTHEVPNCRPGETKPRIQVNRAASCNEPESKIEKPKNIPSDQPGLEQEKVKSTLNLTNPGSWNRKSTQELITPLLEAVESGEPRPRSVENQEGQRSFGSTDTLMEESSLSFEEDDEKRKKAGRKTRMLDLRKKVGEKLEEKRRHIEERSRNIVEKMRGP